MLSVPLPGGEKAKIIFTIDYKLPGLLSQSSRSCVSPDPPANRCSQAILVEKAHHFARSIRALCVHARAPGPSAKPGVAAAVPRPVFENNPSMQIAVNRAGKRVASRHLAAFCR